MGKKRLAIVMSVIFEMALVTTQILADTSFDDGIGLNIVENGQALGNLEREVAGHRIKAINNGEYLVQIFVDSVPAFVIATDMIDTDLHFSDFASEIGYFDIVGPVPNGLRVVYGLTTRNGEIFHQLYIVDHVDEKGQRALVLLFPAFCPENIYQKDDRIFFFVEEDSLWTQAIP
jgi:hypothetical protein